MKCSVNKSTFYITLVSRFHPPHLTKLSSELQMGTYMNLNTHTHTHTNNNFVKGWGSSMVEYLPLV